MASKSLYVLLMASFHSSDSIVAEQLQDNVSIICGDIIDTSLSQATVVFIYLLPKGIVRLLHKLQTELRPGCRVVTYMFR